MIRAFLFLFLMCLGASPAFAAGQWRGECGIDRSCKLGDRGYHVRVPDDWDGVSPLPVLLHFHGWQRTGAVPMRHKRISGATRKRGVLLVAPNGLDKTWRFRTEGSPDIAFATEVLADVAKRFPVDPDKIYVSGYSFGSAMAWRFVCEQGDGIAALIGIGATLPLQEGCNEAPREVRYVHGLKDTVMRYRPGPDGDAYFPMRPWRDAYRCTDPVQGQAWQAREFLTFERTIWDCPQGRITLDLHPGGHFIPHGWIARQLDELLGLPPSYP